MSTTTLHTPEGKNNFNTTNIPDDQFRRLINLGFTVKEIEKFYAAREYRKDYNRRPEVKEKRSFYNKMRYEKMKEIGSLLR